MSSKDEVRTEVCVPPIKGPCIGQRHLLVILINLGIGVMYCMRVNLNVALVAMINETAIQNTKVSNNSECPAVNISSGTSRHLPKDGEYAWSRELQGLILSSFYWGYLVLQVPSGTLTQRFGGKRALLIGVLWTSAFTAVTPWVATFGPIWLIIVRVLEGVGGGVTFPTAQSMIGRWVPNDEISFLQSIAFSGSMVGTIVGQLSAGPLCESSWGWPSAFYVTAAVGILWSIPWIFFVSDSPEKNSRISADELVYITYYLGQGTQEMSNRKGVPWCRLLTDRAVWAVAIIVGTCNWVFYVLLTCLPQYLSDILHFDISNDGILSSLPYIVGFLPTIISGYLIDLIVAKSCARPIYVRKIMTLGCSLGVSACLCAVTFVPCDASVTIVLLIIMVCLVSICGVGYSPNIQELSPEYCGTLLGFCNSFSTIAGILAPYATDHMTPNRTIKEWQNVFYVASGMSCFGAVIYILFASSTHRPWHVDITDSRCQINEEEALIAEEMTFSSIPTISVP